jgi:hypothetical protein
MNVPKIHTIVIEMPLVPIRKDHLTVLARMDSEEMVHHVKVSSVYFDVS